jgi:hypothetical protein
MHVLLLLHMLLLLIKAMAGPGTLPFENKRVRF